MKRPEEALGDIARLRQTIEHSPFDAVLAVSPESVRYAGDVHIASQSKIRDRLALIVWAKGREPVFVVCAVHEALVRQESWIGEVRTYREFFTPPMLVVAEVLEELGLGRAHLGIESEYLAARYRDQLVRALPELRLGDADELFQRVRMVKTDREIALLREAYRGTAKALFATFVGTVAGESEHGMAHRLAGHILHSGADLVTSTIINAGPNTGMHVGPTGYRVQEGDILKSDCGGLYRSYHSNIGRTAKLGRPSEEDRSIWRRLRAIQHELVAMLRPGNTGRQVFEAAARLHAEAGLPFPYGHNGHGVGLLIHERPLIAPHEDAAYEAGMVSTVETRARWPGRIGYHMEDLYRIGEDGPVLLSDAFDNEEILEV